MSVTNIRRPSRLAKLVRGHLNLMEMVDELENQPLDPSEVLHATIIANSLRGILDQIEEQLEAADVVIPSRRAA